MASVRAIEPVDERRRTSDGRKTASSVARRSSLVRLTREILAILFGPPARRPFAVRLWDGSVDRDAPGSRPRFTLVIRRPGALRRVFLPPSELALGEAYLHDDFDVEGDIEQATGLADVLVDRLRSPLVLARLLPRLLALPTDDRPDAPGRAGWAAFVGRGSRHSRSRDADAIRFHYDVSNDFYALWLDRRMLYTCAYFRTGAEDLEAAQEAKLEHICRKLRLRPGETLLDMGCGWGGLVQYAAERYGVRALGITLSRAQAEWARRRIASAGLGDRCRVEARDFRSLPSGTTFDKVVAVGLFEHVGHGQEGTYFAHAHRLLAPGGLFLHHSGTWIAPEGWARRLFWRQGAFLQRYIFPDAQYLPPSHAIRGGEQAGLEPRDLENLREHYALTLRHWLRRLESRHDEAVALVGEPAYRMFRLYLATSARGYAIGRAGLVQVLFSKPARGGICRLPLTRADLYRDAGGTEATAAAEPRGELVAGGL